MTYIGIGVLGFIVFHLVDLVAIKRLPTVKPLVWFTGCGMVGCGMAGTCLLPGRISLPVWTAVLGWALLGLAALHVFYSLFINLPFRKTYIEKGVSDELVTSGLYALVRHPGVYGLAVLMLALTLVSRAELMAMGALAWLATDIIVVVIQDRFFFTRMFPGYGDYSRVTPMLIPSWRSAASFATSFRLQSLDSRRQTK